METAKKTKSQRLLKEMSGNWEVQRSSSSFKFEDVRAFMNYKSITGRNWNIMFILYDIRKDIICKNLSFLYYKFKGSI